jgi:CheY-like chemotaxis protein
MNQSQTVLLVDDSDDDLFLMRMGFKKVEFRAPVQEVRNGEEAILYLSGEGKYADRTLFPYPTVVLLDLNMPLKNGFDVLAWIQGHGQLKPFSLIVLSASARPEDIQRAFTLGANSYLLKPGTLEQLVVMIRCMLQWLNYNHFPPLG